MPIRRVRRKFEDWRQEPEHVRLRIASLLTAGSGVAITLLWLLVLLPLQLRLTRPEQPEQIPASEQPGAVSGVQDVSLPSPSPQYANDKPFDYAQDKQLYHGTRPSLQNGATAGEARPSLQNGTGQTQPRAQQTAPATPTPTPLPLTSPTPEAGLPVEVSP